MLPYILGHNKFSHLNKKEWEEFVTSGSSGGVEDRHLRSTGSSSTSTSRVLPSILNADELPDELDWTKTRGIITSIKQQGLCGSCYAFAAVAAIEAAYNIQHNFDGKQGKLFSEQQFVDCDPLGGCSGGTM